MPADFDRVTPLASIRLFNPGQGDPVLTDRGFGWYDVLLETGQFGSSSRTAAGEPKLEVLEGIGLVCRPVLALQDTRLTHYTTSGGTWEESRPATGLGRKYRLVQSDTTADLTWSATSTFDLPENPSVAFSLLVPDTPSDHDSVTFPPFVRLEFGGTPPGWAIELSKGTGARLLQRVAGAWHAVADLQDLTGLTLDSEERLVLLRCLRGRIGVSMDRGRSYTWHGDAEGAALTVAAGPFIVRGQGGAVVFGLHQIQYASGVYTSPTRNTFTHRLLPPTPTITGRSSTPGSTSITLADASTPGSGIARYTATLTPQTITGTPFNFHRTPELYAVTFRYPVVRATFSGLGIYTTPWNGSVYTIDIDKPLELDQGTCAITIRLDPDTTFTWSHGRWAKIQVLAGHATASGTENWWTAFTGYVRQVRPETGIHRDVRLTLECVNVTERFRRTYWTDLDRVPLGGQTINAALDQILDSEGLQAADRVWHAAGSLLLPAGRAEEPFEWPKRGESKWETMARIAGYAGLEIVALDDGRLITLPVDWVSPAVDFIWEADPGSDLAALVKRVSNELDSSESATAVIAQGVSESGETLLAYAVNTLAESVPGSAFWTPWREVVQEEIPGTVTLGLCAARAQALARQHFPLRIQPEVVSPMSLGLSRRMRIRITGEGVVGINGFEQYALMTLSHHIEQDPSQARIETRAGLRRL